MRKGRPATIGALILLAIGSSAASVGQLEPGTGTPNIGEQLASGALTREQLIELSFPGASYFPDLPVELPASRLLETIASYKSLAAPGQATPEIVAYPVFTATPCDAGWYGDSQLGWQSFRLPVHVEGASGIEFVLTLRHNDESAFALGPEAANFDGCRGG